LNKPAYYIHYSSGFFTIFKQFNLPAFDNSIIFAPRMKRIASILLLLFALVQAGPAIRAIADDNISVFVADEEKGIEKNSAIEKNDKNRCSFSTSLSAQFSQRITIACHLAEKIHPSPCLEKLTPPPNFC
jgi:hypothetical protein